MPDPVGLPERKIRHDRYREGPILGLTPVGSAASWLRTTLHREPTQDEHDAIDELIPQGGPEFVEYVIRFSLLIALSASIAAFGLLADSAAVVIGAMLVAPLMTPITAAAAATVTARNDRLLASAARSWHGARFWRSPSGG